MGKKKKTIRTTVYLSKEDYEWLQKNRQFTISGLLEWAIKQWKKVTEDVEIPSLEDEDILEEEVEVIQKEDE